VLELRSSAAHEGEKVEFASQAGHSAARSAAHEGEKVEFALQAGAASPHRAGAESHSPHHTLSQESTDSPHYKSSDFIFKQLFQNYQTCYLEFSIYEFLIKMIMEKSVLIPTPYDFFDQLHFPDVKILKRFQNKNCEYQKLFERNFDISNFKKYKDHCTVRRSRTVDKPKD
jgi:hypothetical protein